jgi:hypothetical protein
MNPSFSHHSSTLNTSRILYELVETGAWKVILFYGRKSSCIYAMYRETVLYLESKVCVLHHGFHHLQFY